MNKENQALHVTVMAALDDYHGDTSVSQEETLEGLEELIEQAQAYADAIKADLNVS